MIYKLILLIFIFSILSVHGNLKNQIKIHKIQKKNHDHGQIKSQFDHDAHEKILKTRNKRHPLLKNELNLKDSIKIKGSPKIGTNFVQINLNRYTSDTLEAQKVQFLMSMKQKRKIWRKNNNMFGKNYNSADFIESKGKIESSSSSSSTSSSSTSIQQQKNVDELNTHLNNNLKKEDDGIDNNIKLTEEVFDEKKLATYYGEVRVGQHVFKVLFDTGSSEFWIPSAKCNTERCNKHNRFPIEEQDKLDIIKNLPLDIEYLSGKVKGDMVIAPVYVGKHIGVSNQVVGMGEIVDIALLDDVLWDGIVGLAFPITNYAQQGILPFFDNLITQNILVQNKLQNQFSYYIDSTKGVISFGGVDCSVFPKSVDCTSAFNFIPIIERSYWTVGLNGVKLIYPNGQVVQSVCDPVCKAIVDTGTYLIYGPKTDNTIMNNLLGPEFNCGNYNSFPSIAFDFYTGSSDRSLEIVLKPEDYMLEFETERVGEGKVKDCTVGIERDDDITWTLGQVFVRSVYTVFDREFNNEKIGFAYIGA